MTSVADFIRLPKVDTHNHLDIGMRYSSYVPWAGFYIPDFPPTGCAPEDTLFSEIEPYTHARTRTEKDVLDLLNLSLMEAVGDGVTVVYGTVNFNLMQHCNGVEGFAEVINKIIEKYKDRVTLIPILGIDSSDKTHIFEKSVIQLIRSQVFKGIDVYGEEAATNPEDFKEIFKLAENFGLKKKIHGEYCKTTEQLLSAIKTISPDEIQQGTAAVNDKSIMRFIADHNITMNLCPQMCIKTGVLKEYHECPMRKLADANIHVTLCTDSLLVFNKSISEQCSELCNAGLFTKDEMIKLISPATK